MSTDVPLICDPAPGEVWVVNLDRPVTPETAERIRRGIVDGLLVLEPGIKITPMPGAAAWPDAEHCAA